MLLVNIFIDYMFYPYNGRPINVNCSLLIAKYPQTPHQTALSYDIHGGNKKRREPQINPLVHAFYMKQSFVTGLK